jgi:hypothetical protein
MLNSRLSEKVENFLKKQYMNIPADLSLDLCPLIEDIVLEQISLLLLVMLGRESHLSSNTSHGKRCMSDLP